MSVTPNNGPVYSAGRVRPDGSRLYRLPTALIIWWVWVAFVVVGVGDVVIQGHQWIPAKFAFGLLAVTGLIYACTWWPKVVAHEAGLTVWNPFRTYIVAWDVVEGVYLGESVEVSCHRGAGRRPKTIYCWALPSSRRARAKAEMRAKRAAGRRGWGFEPPGLARGGQGAAEARNSMAVLIAREIAELTEKRQVTEAASPALDDRAPEDRAAMAPVGRWAWQPAVAFGVPVIAFAIAMLAG